MCTLHDPEMRVDNYVRDEEGNTLMISYAWLQSAVLPDHALPCVDVTQCRNSQNNSICNGLQAKATACESDKVVTSPLRQGNTLLQMMCSVETKPEEGGIDDVKVSIHYSWAVLAVSLDIQLLDRIN